MSDVDDAVLDFGWSLWTELGIAGARRQHVDVAIDPELLILFTPALFARDVRLVDEAAHWCIAQQHRLSATRIAGLRKAAPPTVTSAFDAFAAPLQAHGGVWKTGTLTKSTVLPQRTRVAAPKLERPALVHLRLRALAGVGARADVLGALLVDDVWRVAADFAQLGYSKRNVARVLAELAEAGFAESSAVRNTTRYRLAEGPLTSLRAGLRWPAWPELFAFVDDVLQLDDERDKPAGVRRVAAARFAARWSALTPSWTAPSTHDEAWERTTQFALASVRWLADGATTLQR